MHQRQTVMLISETISAVQTTAMCKCLYEMTVRTGKPRKTLVSVFMHVITCVGGQWRWSRVPSTLFTLYTPVAAISFMLHHCVMGLD